MKHYPALPHGPLEEVFEGIWFVQGAVKMPLPIPMRISRSMTVVRNPVDGGLTVINAMRLSEAGLRELEALGPVKHVLRIGAFHGRDDGFYQERYGAKLYAVRGQRYTRKMDVAPKEEDYLEPDEWLDEESSLPIDCARLIVVKSSTPPEGLLLLQRDGGILITADSLQNTPKADQFVNFPAKVMMKKMGFFGPHLVGAGWLKFAKPSADEIRSLLDHDFEHVLPGHGEVVRGDAKKKYMPAINGPLKGCHA